MPDEVRELPNLPPGGGRFTAHAHRGTGAAMSATAAVAVASLGARASWIGRLGDDAVAQTLLDLLARHAAETARVVATPGGRSPTSGVFLGAEGEWMPAAFPGFGLPERPGVDAAWLDGAGAVLGDPRWPEGSAQLFRLAAAALKAKRGAGWDGMPDRAAVDAPLRTGWT